MHIVLSHTVLAIQKLQEVEALLAKFGIVDGIVEDRERLLQGLQIDHACERNGYSLIWSLACTHPDDPCSELSVILIIQLLDANGKTVLDLTYIPEDKIWQITHQLSMVKQSPESELLRMVLESHIDDTAAFKIIADMAQILVNGSQPPSLTAGIDSAGPFN